MSFIITSLLYMSIPLFQNLTKKSGRLSVPTHKFSLFYQPPEEEPPLLPLEPAAALSRIIC